MAKQISLKCDSGGEVITARIGAPKEYATLQDVLVHLPDEKESDKILEIMMKLSDIKEEYSLPVFYMNKADGLVNVNYAVAGEVIPLYGETVRNAMYNKFTPEMKAKITQSQARWAEAYNQEGVIAFDALYYCRKCKNIQKGLFLRIKYTADKKERLYLYQNKCEKCKNDLTIIDDCNMGFLNEGVETLLTCPKCGGNLMGDLTNFKNI